MFELFIDFLVLIFGEKAFKKLKARWKERKLERSGLSDSGQAGMGPSSADKVTVCTSCSRPFKEPPVYERGKPWCPDCYKTKLLNIRES